MRGPVLDALACMKLSYVCTNLCLENFYYLNCILQSAPNVSVMSPRDICL